MQKTREKETEAEQMGKKFFSRSGNVWNVWNLSQVLRLQMNFRIQRRGPAWAAARFTNRIRESSTHEIIIQKKMCDAKGVKRGN